MFKNWKLYLLLIAIILVAIILFLLLKPGAPTEPPADLLGMWTFTGRFLQPGTDTELIIQLNTIEPAGEDTYLGNGCMQTGASGGWAPLSMQAVYNPASGEYTLNMLSTLVAPELEAGAAVIRLVGSSEMGSGGLKDDAASGVAYLVTGEIAWAGGHSSLEIIQCPAWDAALTFRGEFGLHRDLATIPPWDGTNFLSETMIVSSQMQVETPDGQVFLANYHTDIFTPEVNFIDHFRFDYSVEGAPVVAQPYIFTLLDAIGAPVPGFESHDTFQRCDQGAATNLHAEFIPQEGITLTWDAPEIIPDYFDPENGHGLYQATLDHDPWQEGTLTYGAEMISTSHHIPWNTFEPGAAGVPDGQDYGISLSEIEDGRYILFIGTYSYYEPAPGETGFDCRVTDSRQALFITRQGEQITIQPAGAVSGFVTDADGNPLGGIAVAIDGVGTGFHEAVCSRENGYYLFTRLPLDTFRVSAGSVGTEDCPPNDYASIVLPELELTFDVPIRQDIDFVLRR